jgi:hypothetical protein
VKEEGVDICPNFRKRVEREGVDVCRISGSW